MNDPAFRHGLFIDDRNPADEAVRAEEGEGEEQSSELANMLGRLICWVLESDKPKNIGLRFIVLTYEMRPDLINGKTLREIAKLCRCKKSFPAKLVREFRAIFGLRGRNARPHARASLRAAWRRANEQAPQRIRKDHHLDVVNRFFFWKSDLERYPETRPDPDAVLRDFKPVLEFLLALRFPSKEEGNKR